MKRLKLFALVAVAVAMAACGGSEGDVKLISTSKFNKEIEGKNATIYTLKNRNGMTMQVTNFGARIVSLWVPDKDGKFRDVVLGLNNAEEYQNADEKYYGATIGRYANRLSRGYFEIEGDGYEAEINDGVNSLHGGSKGFHYAMWNAKPYRTQDGEEAIEFEYLSPSGEAGYPGNLTAQVRYVLGQNNQLKIFYQAQSDANTIVNMTNHSYFNLNGEGSATIEDHLLTINADSITPVDSTLIPTGKIVPVSETPFDFKTATKIGERINSDDPQIKYGLGYDHNWVLNSLGSLTSACELYAPESGIVMKLETDAPGLQFYSGNFIKGKDIGKSGKPYNYRSALCLEPQAFPDSPNHANFPSTLLKRKRGYNTASYYTFSVKK